MKLPRFRLILIIALLSSVSLPLVLDRSIFSASPAIAQISESRKAEADRLFEQGNQQYHTSQFQTAIQFLQQALVIYQEIEYSQGEASSLRNLGDVYYSQGEYQTALEFHKQSLPISQQINDTEGEASSLGSLGNVYYSLGEYQTAIKFLEWSLQISQQINNRQGEASPLRTLGNVYYSLGEYQTAIDFLERSLQIFQQINNRQGGASSLGYLGNVYYSLGEYQTAIDIFQHSLRISQYIGDRQGEASFLGYLGSAYHSLGKHQKAIDLHEQSLRIFQQIGDRQGEASSLGSLGSAYYSLEEYQTAIEYYQQSLRIFQQIGNRQGEASSLGYLGSAYYSLGKHQKAIDLHEQSLLIKRQIGNRQGEAFSLGYLGSAYYSLGKYQKAIDLHEQSLLIFQEIGNRQGEAFSLEFLGLAISNSGSLETAETILRKGIEVLDSLRVGLKDLYKVAIFETQSNIYNKLQQVLIGRGKTNDALEIAERGRARALVDLLKQGTSPRSNTPPPLEYPSLEQIQQIAQQQDATLVEYSIIDNEQLYIWVVPPIGEIEFRAVDLPEDISLAELVDNGRACILQDQCRSNGDRTPLNVGDLVKFKDDQFEDPWQVVEVDVRQGILKVKLEGFEGELIERQMTDVAAIVNAFNRQHLQQLHQLLIQPIADLLPENENERVIFIPHQQLFLVPFPALQNENGDYLIEKHTILTAPSIEVLGLTRQQRQNLPDSVRGVLVVGNPTMPSITTQAGEAPRPLSDLPHAETEAIEIARLLGTPAFTGHSATKTVILPKLSKARWIHLATHGLFNFQRLDVLEDIPGAIALAPSGTGELNDGLLTAGELLQMKLNAELVVLSACKTGQGDITSDGVIGLSRSLVAAGVPSLIVSLWSVPDAPTAELMMRFYQNLDGTDDKAQALRIAMLDTMAEHPNPKNWAAFTLIGEAF